MSDIRVNAFKDYRVERNPKVAQTIDNTINREWWDAGGAYTPEMYGEDVKNFKKELPKADLHKGLFVRAGSFMNIFRTENYQKLEKVFDFIEQKEGYVNPIREDERTKEIMKPGVIYLGELGFGVVKYKNNMAKKGGLFVEVPYFVPFPVSQRFLEEEELEISKGTLITDIKDGGIFVWNDALEAKYADLAKSDFNNVI
tara:strand:- start:776 stop:1372 length:597 start_codon:yes stop_codon:yes gene_type:complete